MYFIMDVITVFCGTRENQFKLSHEIDRKSDDLDTAQIVINAENGLKQKQ